MFPKTRGGVRGSQERIRLAAGKSAEGNLPAMGKDLIVLGAALLLSGCGGYFDQHPQNVRPESEAVATVLARQRPVVSTQAGPVTESPRVATQSQVAETVLPPAVPPAPQRAVAPVRSTPPEAPAAMTLPPKSAAAVAFPPSPAAPPARTITSVPDAVPFTRREAPATVESEPAPQPASAVAIRPSEPVPAVAMHPVPKAQPVFVPALPPQRLVPPPPANPGVARPAPVATPAETAAVAPSPPTLPAESAPLSTPQTAPTVQGQQVSQENSESPPSEVHSPVPVQPAAPAVVMQPVPEMLPVAAASPPPAAPAAASAPPAPDARCEAVAKQRADDAGANGLDRETQEIVRGGAYADCLAWYRAHPSAVP
jgi:hypothetical protein